MKEPVRRTRRPWLVGVCVAAIVGIYVFLLAGNRFPKPGPNLLYDTTPFEQVDDVETRFVETGRIVPEIEDPQAIAVGPDGRIYVAGKKAASIHDEDGAELMRFELSGPATSIAVSGHRAILLGLRDHVEVLDLEGVVQAEWESLGARAYISSIAVSDEEVFVADAGNRVVLRYDHEGVLLGRIGEADPDRDVPGLVVPSPYLDIAFDDRGTLWVANPGRLGLENYRSDGGLITSWYRPSLDLDGFSGCCNPSHIAFRSDGKLITCEKGLVRVKVYDAASGAFEELVAGSNLFPKEQSVRDLAVDAKNRILVLDPRQNAIRIFEEQGESNEKTRDTA